MSNIIDFTRKKVTRDGEHFIDEKGHVWFLYAITYEMDDGEFVCFIWAKNDTHADEALTAIKLTGETTRVIDVVE